MEKLCVCVAPPPLLPYPQESVVQYEQYEQEELAQKIKGYQEQIASLNSKCKMVSVKAKHATMLLTVSDVEGLPVGLDHLDHLENLEHLERLDHLEHLEHLDDLDDLDEDRAKKAPAVTAGRGTLSRASVQQLYDPTFDTVANLDDLQRSWETLKNVVRGGLT
ncbi:hypothetical protein CRUP_026783 [Coryphaenoides rupestris]|nr:hypothetical protein CRUP_026783 [Coryphaenoides rupestris]